ncbi:alcohol dehydrogenase catalytic domain-containing protein [Actinomadura sp. NTSP31]|uniref:alcohol dehydrogenase catalytic domain-containing protein n=1 Tax=Actinomadura sp. NTSP31 TaxID=1735447 RepID=UPI0035C14D6A
MTADAVAMVWPGAGGRHQAVTARPEEPAPGEALVEVELATICGSDLHTVSGRRPGPAPGVLGHEIVGRVVRLGDGPPPRDVRDRAVGVGDRVAIGIYAACGECVRCRRDLPQKCERLFKYGHVPLAEAGPLSGGYATHVRVRAGTPLAVVPPDLPAALAAPLGCATATAVAAVAAGGAGVGGRNVTVCGAGLLGLLATAMLADRGAAVTVVDPDAGRRATAKLMGAANTVGLTAEPPPADVYIELSGAPAAARDAVARTATGGTIVLAGTVSPGAPLDWEAQDLVRGLLTVRGVHNYAPAHLAEAAAWTESAAARLPLDALLGAVHPLENLDAALQEAARSGSIRVGVAPGEIDQGR